MLSLLIFILLPLLEIAGFVVIGGEIGLGMSLLWVIAAAIGGFYTLITMGAQTMVKAQKSVEADVYPMEEMFDGFCILIGSLLLIFPGFISDFLSLLFLIPMIRKGIFLILKSQNESVLDGFSKNAQGFTCWYSEKTNGGDNKETIEGEFTRVDNNHERLS